MIRRISRIAQPLAPSGAKYADTTSAIEDIRIDAIEKLMSSRQLYEKYSPLMAFPTTYNSFRVVVNRHGIAATRRALVAKSTKIKIAATAAIRKRARSKANVIIRKKAEAIARTNVGKSQGISHAIVAKAEKAKLSFADRHLKRMRKIVKKAHRVVEEIEPEQGNIQHYIHTANMFDDLARKTYGMDKSQSVSPHQVNVAVVLNLERALAGAAPSQLTERDAELSEDDLILADS